MDREQTTEKLRNWTFDPFEYELYDLQQLVRRSALLAAAPPRRQAAPT
jgi:hypothetical protein